MPDKLTVRPATREDIDTLVQFNQAIASETEDKTLAPDTVRRGVHALFDDPSRGFYLVAVRADTIVGSVMITTEWSDWRNGLFWWIQSVYVRPDARRSGVYTALHEAVRSRAADTEEVCGLRLYVDDANQNARDTYESLGMTETGYRLYEEML